LRIGPTAREIALAPETAFPLSFYFREPPSPTPPCSISLPSRKNLFGNDLQLPAHSNKSIDGPVQLLPVMSGGYLHPDSGLALGYHRIEKPDHIDAFVQKPGGHFL